MFDGVLDLSLELIVVLVATAGLEVDQKAELVVKSEQLVLLACVDFQLGLEARGVTASHQVGGSAVETVAIFGDVCLNANTVLFINDSVLVVGLGAILANHFGLLNINKDLIWEADVDESVQTATVLLEKLSFLRLVWVVNKDEAFLSSRGKSEKLDRDLLGDDFLLVARSDDLTDFIEEGVLEVGILVCFTGGVLHELGNGHDGHTYINGEPK